MRPIVCVESFFWDSGLFWRMRLKRGLPIGEATVTASGYLSGFAIDPKYRGQGLGGWFLDAISAGEIRPKSLAACPFYKPTLDLQGLVSFYERHGWRKAVSSGPRMNHPSVQYMERT